MKDENQVSERVKRIAEAATRILDRLDSGARLSLILPQIRSLLSECGDQAQVFLLDLLMYGLDDVPNELVPTALEARKRALDEALMLRHIYDVPSITADTLLSGGAWPSGEKVIPYSTGELERGISSWHPIGKEYAPYLTADDIVRHRLQHDEECRVLERQRAYLHKLVSDVHAWALAEKESQALLGRDYRLVIDSIGALDTAVGQELLAALDNLRSDNPAKWNAAALSCRNVVLKLGRLLFVSEAETYQSELAQRELGLGGDKELNKLCAYLDQAYRRAEAPVKARLVELDKMARDAYQTGSRGKRQIRLADAQRLVVNTFEFVSELEQITNLEPVHYEQ